MRATMNIEPSNTKKCKKLFRLVVIVQLRSICSASASSWKCPRTATRSCSSTNFDSFLISQKLSHLASAVCRLAFHHVGCHLGRHRCTCLTKPSASFFDVEQGSQRAPRGAKVVLGLRAQIFSFIWIENDLSVHATNKKIEN